MLPRAMQAGVAVIEAGGTVRDATGGIEQALLAAGFASVDYVTLCRCCDAGAAAKTPTDRRACWSLRASDSTRLIDNWPVNPR